MFNTPDAQTLAVAELTIVLILSLLRKINQAVISIKNRKWEKKMGSLLCGKKVGIIGFGKIGRKVAELLKSFHCEIAYCDPFVGKNILGCRNLPKEELLIWADIVSIHASAKEKILGEEELKTMRKGAWLINVSRGNAINESALYRYLKKGHLSGAALDVFKQEPYSGPLRELDNVVLTPHIGSYAKEARIRMEKEAVDNLLKGLREAEGKK